GAAAAGAGRSVVGARRARLGAERRARPLSPVVGPGAPGRTTRHARPPRRAAPPGRPGETARSARGSAARDRSRRTHGTAAPAAGHPRRPGSPGDGPGRSDGRGVGRSPAGTRAGPAQPGGSRDLRAIAVADASLSGAAREAPGTAPSPPAGLLLAPLGRVDEHLLAALPALARYAPDVRTVGLHLPGAVPGRELRIEHRAQLLPEQRVFDGRHHLDATLEVALHAVGGADQVFLLAAVAEVVDTAVLQEAPHYAHHADRLRQAGHTRPQAAGVADDQIDLHAGLRRSVERLGDVDVLEGVHLELDQARR